MVKEYGWENNPFAPINGDDDATTISEEYAKIADTKKKADTGDAAAQADMVV